MPLLVASLVAMVLMWNATQRLRAEQQEILSLSRTLSSQPALAGASVARQRATLLNRFPKGEASIRHMLAGIFIAAEAAGVSLDQGSYSLEREPDTALARYVMSLPVQGSYGEIRQFVIEALGAHPTLALRSMGFERPEVSDSLVEARMVFAFYYLPEE